MSETSSVKSDTTLTVTQQYVNFDSTLTVTQQWVKSDSTLIETQKYSVFIVEMIIWSYG